MKLKDNCLYLDKSGRLVMIKNNVQINDDGTFNLDKRETGYRRNLIGAFTGRYNTFDETDSHYTEMDFHEDGFPISGILGRVLVEEISRKTHPEYYL